MATQISVLTQANEAAVAGLVDVNIAADVLTSSMNAYATSGLTAQQASDALFVAVKEGKTTFGELAASLGQVAPTASAAGITFQEMTGTLAAITKNGVSTAEAVTGLKAIISSIIKPSVEAAKAAKELGIEFSVAGVQKAGGFANFLGKVKEATNGNIETLSRLIPNLQGLGPAAGIVTGDLDSFRATLDATENSLGATSEAAEVMKDSLDFKLNQLNQAWTNLRIELADKLAPALTVVANKLTEVIKDATTSRDTAFIQATDDVDKLTVKLEQLQRHLKNINEDGKVSFFEDDPEEVQANIDAIKTKLAEIDTKNAKDEVAALEMELKKLKEAGVDPILQASLYGSPEAAKERQAQLEAQLANIRDMQKMHNEELNAEADAQTEKEIVKQEEKFNILQELKAQQKATEDEQKLVEKEAKAYEDNAEFERLKKALGKETAERELHRIKNIKDEKKQKDELKKLNDKARKEEQVATIAYRKWEDQSRSEKLANIKSTLGTISTLTGSSNKTLFNIGKAAALAQHAVNVPKSISQALSSAPPPFNFALAALVGTAMAAQGVKIASAKPPSAGGFAEGGLITGPSAVNDRLTANVNAGETILNRRQTDTVFRAINEGNIGGQGVNVTINNPMVLEQGAVDDIIDQINDAIEFRNKELRVS